ncbi:MAG: DUF4174 domain-containing protein [Janthinobacterium lividum]
MLVIHQIFCVLGALAVPLLAAPTAPAPVDLVATLRASRWQHRLLLLGAPTVGQADLQAQKELLAAAATGLVARDFRVLEVPYDQLTAADRQCWTQQLGQPLAGFRVVLIGKDGGVKRASAQPLPPADLFNLVDKMPMRRQEMRGKKE